mmetsp:Transcript_4607/g.6884  ORF Transcript_4607/g.6884 Transcript_4607/m.6884 type:complete len:292 (+) Transcript_4607:34-909(+)
MEHTAHSLWRAVGDVSLKEVQAEKYSFWGAITATMDWCEENYVFTTFIAEFWNTLSNAAIVGMAVYGYLLSKKYYNDICVELCCIGLGVVGIGSTAFHATLWYWGQMLDELPMVWAACTFVYAIPSREFRKKYNFLLMLGCAGYGIGVTIIYLIVNFPAFHEICYGIAVAATIIQLIIFMKKHKDQREKDILSKLLFHSMAYSAGAFFVWNIDNLLCIHLRSFRKSLGWPFENLTQLHAWWHVGTGIGSYCFIMTIAAVRQLDAKNRIDLGWSTIVPGLQIPYVITKSAVP